MTLLEWWWERNSEKDKWIFKNAERSRDSGNSRKNGSVVKINPVLPSLLPGTHAVWLTTAWNSSSRRSDASGFHGSGTHVYIPMTGPNTYT